ncbi:MAG TPA: TIR domain-containing protein [Burkholderiaceae bacterium]|nr:TIR domain-containing protein [Burkholderiaceae bacterium]HNG78864.1 TIR domain-containing protein [Burkholderiaceae bacterium]
MSRLFISHSSANNAIALALGQWLESQGWSDYFLDVHADRGIAPGERWMAALTGAVDRCEAVLFLVSPAWRDSKYCFAEFFEAKKLGKRIFGVIVEPIALSELPEQMTAEWQVCDLCHADEPVTFSVERRPLLPRTNVVFPKAGLDALASGLRKAGLDPATFEWPPAGEPDRSPYPGLRALDRADAAVFFGREAAIVRGIDQIRLTGERGVEPLFVILGASGAGKSSFLRAGLLPRLARDSDRFIVLPTLRCERAALSGPAGLWAVLRQALEQAGQRMSLAQVREAVAAQGLGRVLHRLRGRPEKFGGATGAAHSTDARTLVVPIDQFEELFATDGQKEATEFLQLITQALPSAGSGGSPGAGRLLLLVTIRSDALPTLQNHPLLRELKPVLFSLPAMAPSNFKEVIEGPARRHSERHRLTIDPALTEALLADAQGPDALPLLALTLEWLLRDFGQRDGTELGLTQYGTIGRVSGVIDRAVQRALTQPDHPPAIPRGQAEQDALLHRLFGFIATVDPDTLQPKRRVALRSDLRQALGAEGDSLISRLVEQRLLVADARSGDSGGPAIETVEIAHEALLRQWGVMQRWLAEMAEGLTAVESLRRCAADWLRSERDEALLVHTGHRLDTAEAIRQDEQLRHRLDAGDAEYLEACRARDARVARERDEQLQQIARQQAARARWQKRFAWALGIAFVGVASLLAWIVKQTREVSVQTSLALSAASERASDDGHFASAVRLALLAARNSWLHPRQPDALAPLLRAVAGNRELLVLRHESEVKSAVFSPNGELVLTVSRDNSVRVWSAHTGQQQGSTIRHKGEIGSAVFSPDGLRLLTASTDKTAQLWDVQSGQPIGVPMMHDKEVMSAIFSPDGLQVLTIANGRIVQIWNLQTGRIVCPPMQHKSDVESAVFSLDGLQILTIDKMDDGAPQVWDARSCMRQGAQFLYDPGVWEQAYSPDHQYISIYVENRGLIIRNIKTGQEIFKQPSPMTFRVAFSPDAQRVAAVDANNNVHSWEVSSGKKSKNMMSHARDINSIEYSSDGFRILTASKDKVARLWDAHTGTILAPTMKHDAPVNSAVFSPDGKRVLTSSEDMTARIWDVSESSPAPIIHNDSIESVKFIQSGQLIVTASADHTARIWERNTGQPITPPLFHREKVKGVEISPDGSRVLTFSDDKTARLWHVPTGWPLGVPMKHFDIIHAAKFSEDGKMVLTGSKDRTARVWDAFTGESIGVNVAHEDEVYFVRFLLDDTRIMTKTKNNTIHLWDANTGRQISGAIEDRDLLSDTHFDSDGRWFFTISHDQLFKLWGARTGNEIAKPFSISNTNSRVIFNKNEFQLLTSSDDGFVQFWDAKIGRKIGEPIAQKGDVVSMALSPSGKLLVTTTRNGRAQLWDAIDRRPLGSPMKHGQDLVFGLDFSPNEALFWTLSVENSIQQWDMATRQPLGEPIWEGVSDGFGAIFSKDGSAMVVAMDLDALRIWPIRDLFPRQVDTLTDFACKKLDKTVRLISERDPALSRILPQGFQVGDDVCKDLPSAVATVH